MHENQPTPSSLSQNGFLRSGRKADLLTCLEDECVAIVEKPKCDVCILDGQVIVHLLPETGCKNFKDYASKKVIPYIETQLEKHDRVDISWDIYRETSLKVDCRIKRGLSTRLQLMGSASVLFNCQEFLQND